MISFLICLYTIFLDIYYIDECKVPNVLNVLDHKKDSGVSITTNITL